MCVSRSKSGVEIIGERGVHLSCGCEWSRTAAVKLLIIQAAALNDHMHYILKLDLLTRRV